MVLLFAAGPALGAKYKATAEFSGGYAYTSVCQEDRTTFDSRWTFRGSYHPVNPVGTFSELKTKSRVASGTIRWIREDCLDGTVEEGTCPVISMDDPDLDLDGQLDGFFTKESRKRVRLEFDFNRGAVVGAPGCPAPAFLYDEGYTCDGCPPHGFLKRKKLGKRKITVPIDATYFAAPVGIDSGSGTISGKVVLRRTTKK